MRLSGKVAIVTGAGSGIGKATAELFANEGAWVVAVAWNKDSGEPTAAAIRQGGGDAMFCHADVSKSRDVQTMIDSTLQRYGKLDILVNNAAVQIMPNWLKPPKKSGTGFTA